MPQGQISANKTRTNITIEKELKSQLEELANRDGRSFNNYVINILKKHVKTLNQSNKML